MPRRLSELQGDDPLILTLARGHYCPKDHQHHLELAAFYPKIAVAYTRIATIATDEHHRLQEFRASVGAQWPFLSDPRRIVQRELDIQEYTDPDNDPMIPHTLVLGPGLVIHSIYNGYWFLGAPLGRRPVARPVRAHARDPPRLGPRRPGLREAWDARDYTPFHGWDKRTGRLRDVLRLGCEAGGLRSRNHADRVQERGRAAEVELLRHGDEVPQVPQFDHARRPLAPYQLGLALYRIAVARERRRS